MSPPSFEFDFNSAPGGGFRGRSFFSTGLFINNEFVDAVDGNRIGIVNPTSGKTIGIVAAATEKDVDIAVRAAREAFEQRWGMKAPPTERRRLLNRLADLVAENADELSALEALENGKALIAAKMMDVEGTIGILRYFAGWADKIQGKTIEVNDSKLAYTRHEPIGVVGQIIPWNLPLGMFTVKIAPALATGNTVVIKPSEWTPLTAIRMCELIKEAGFPKGVINVVTGYGDTAGAAIASHMDIDKVAFTGSSLVGRHVMKAAAASNLKRVTLELGGKSPNIIFQDADLDRAVSWAAFGALANQGQLCIAGSRVFVHEDIYDKFLAAFTEKMKSVRIGDPFLPDTFQGPQVTETHFNRIMNYIEIGKREGATVHLGGERYGAEGLYIQPTIFTDVKADMTIMKEEIFGPVVVIAKFSSDEEAVRMANDTVYGLAAGLFTCDVSRAISVANQLKAGTVWINCYGASSLNAPFGGYKQSGIGRELGEYALEHYTAVKAVHINMSASPPI
ncbi:aldehyde dehydrogenase domain-containing protein [Cantharellus anzutake]|uniref:aldehyde dehydrogenase domain-containing protein n=1 Tax=Cantharellus anzutake TaxID=1750568 RepID=UPI0019072C0B|nr:aldehyde dehydrogenase domain-containing protein [Cantharellus anzutake]XP_038911618.1 aldehyde dehydrogenase domain-containing protein [Cantharellus anzutake]KAF8314575.1 aldehyde dehydrogenase domain-containing protein [Cantharellus anzutake]KAF8324537.1 aldehyde dehydrogenase domain-containing protein [Cantharellus anzutake]